MSCIDDRIIDLRVACVEQITQYDKWDIETAKKVGVLLLGIDETCNLLDLHFEPEPVVKDHCTKCDCNEFLCGHNSRG